VQERRPARLRGAPQRRGRRALRVPIVVDGGYNHAAGIARCHAGGHGVPRLVGRDCWRRRRLPLLRHRPCVGRDPVRRSSIPIDVRQFLVFNSSSFDVSALLELFFFSTKNDVVSKKMMPRIYVKGIKFKKSEKNHTCSFHYTLSMYKISTSNS
jgi:hypothetical protein